MAQCRAMKIGLRNLHAFIVKKLPGRLLRRYKRYEILNERELEFLVSKEIKRFVRQDDEKGRLSVHNCLFLKDSRTYPDVIVMKKGKPWIVIELKEKGNIQEVTVFDERAKILHIKEHSGLKRAYVMYIGRWGKHRKIGGPKGEFRHWFYEVPITLERAGMPPRKIDEFELELRKRNKYKVAHA
jgi:hypothetical protein